MPLAPPDGTRLMVQLIVAASDSPPLPRTIQVDSAWVVNDTLVWATRPSDQRPRVARSPAILMLRSGPKWDRE